MDKANEKEEKHAGKFRFSITAILFDILSVCLTVFICVVSTFGFDKLTGPEIWALVFFTMAMSAFLVMVLAAFQVYRMITINFGLGDAVQVALIVFFVGVVSFTVMHFVPRKLLPHISLPICALGILALIAFCYLSRAMRRIIEYTKQYRQKIANRKNGIKTLVVGAGSGGKLVLTELEKNPDNRNNIVVYADDDPKKIGKTMSGIPVQGPISEIPAIIEKYQIEEAIIAIEAIDQAKLSEILSYFRDTSVRVKRLPVLSELGSVNEKTIFTVDISELLGRPSIVLDNSELGGMLQGKTVLVTGAGGTIGSELVRQIYKVHPSTLVLFDIYENGLYSIQQEIIREIRKDKREDLNLVALVGSTYNAVRVEQILRKYHPDYVYHAAAYKHVPLMEDSPEEAIRTNDVGTYNVAYYCDKYAVKKMLLVSTDKAVRPTNAMGASKRFAEMIIQYFAKKSSKTIYCAVRFGNVIGSNGSVIPLFQKEIQEGGPVTVTNPDIIRYFMTIPEAVGLILQSSIYAEKGEIFILDMGKPVKILTVAEKMIRQAGYEPYKDMPILFVGLRPGEKLYEETLLDPTTQKKTANSKIYIEERGETTDLTSSFPLIEKAFELDTTPNDAKDILKQLVTTYQPQKTPEDLKD